MLLYHKIKWLFEEKDCLIAGWGAGLNFNPDDYYIAHWDKNLGNLFLETRASYTKKIFDHCPVRFLANSGEVYHFVYNVTHQYTRIRKHSLSNANFHKLSVPIS